MFLKHSPYFKREVEYLVFTLYITAVYLCFVHVNFPHGVGDAGVLGWVILIGVGLGVWFASMLLIRTLARAIAIWWREDYRYFSVGTYRLWLISSVGSLIISSDGIYFIVISLT